MKVLMNDIACSPKRHLKMTHLFYDVALDIMNIPLLNTAIYISLKCCFSQYDFSYILFFILELESYLVSSLLWIPSNKLKELVHPHDDATIAFLVTGQRIKKSIKQDDLNFKITSTDTLSTVS